MRFIKALWEQRQKDTAERTLVPYRTEAQLRHLGMVSFLHPVPEAFMHQVVRDEAARVVQGFERLLHDNPPADSDHNPTPEN